MVFELCKNLEVFFCGTVQLFAHFILCYRGMSLTIVDFLLCLELYIKSVLGDESLQITANLVLVWPDKLWCLTRLCHLVNEILTNVLALKTLVGSLLTGHHILQSVTTAVYSHLTHTQPTHILFLITKVVSLTGSGPISYSDHEGGQPDRIRIYY